MLLDIHPSLYFFAIILMVGLLTSLTDFRQRKIFNIHLVIGAGLGTIAAWPAFLIDPKMIISQIVSGGLASLVGWLLFRFNLWRGGDAKLFILYAFLMPPLEHETRLYSDAIRLFASSFIFGMILYMPVFIKDIISDYRAITSDFLAKRDATLQAATTSILFSWVLFPLYALANITNPIVILTISYLLFIWGYDASERKNYFINFIREKYLQFGLSIIFGFILRLWLVPHSLSLQALGLSFCKIAMFTALSSFIHTALNHLKDYRDRVSFAPLLFIGCLLSYTPFLSLVTYLFRQ